MVHKAFKLFLLALITACATTPRGPAPIDPVGTFDFNTTVNAQAVSGTIIVEEQSNGYGGTIQASGIPNIPILSVVVDGQQMTVATRRGELPLEIVMTFTEDAFTGNWFAYGEFGVEDSGSISGRRR